MVKANKIQLKKRTETDLVWNAEDGVWRVVRGELARAKRGRRKKQDDSHLFQVVGEKLPKECIEHVKRDFKDRKLPVTGVYIAHIQWEHHGI